ncbi:MAG: RidA family protein [Chloroflexi bacterium]|nr:RidA family protein [Chloroflexota bacterium]
MTKKTYPNDLPYPFSDAVQTGNLLFLSGQVGICDGKVGEGIEEQTRFTMESIREVLAQAGATLEDIVKVTVFITDMSLWPKMNEAYKEYFPHDPPARSAFGVNGLALPELLVEIECVAEVAG